MSEQVVIKNKTGLEEHGITILEISKSYEVAVSQAYQKFNVTVNDGNNQGAAIMAFLDKLNTLQVAVFEAYPRVLTMYGQVVIDYVSQLEQAGFSRDEIASDLEGITGVKTVLIGEQYEEMTDIKTKLEQALSQATNLLGQNPINLAPILASAEQDLSVCRDNRAKTHDSLFLAQTTFIKNLESIRKDLEPMIQSLANARYIGSMPVSTVIQLIQDNQLTPTTVKMLDYLQDSGDGVALSVLLGAGDKTELFGNLGRLDATYISQPMMDIVYSRVQEEFFKITDNKSVEIDYLNNFLIEVAKQPKKQAATYLEKLLLSGDRWATLQSAEALLLIPEFPNPATELSIGAYEAVLASNKGDLMMIEERLSKAGVLTGLFESLYVIGIGQESKVVMGGGRSTTVDTSIHFVDGSLNFSSADNGISYSIDRSGQSTLEVSTTHYDSYKGADGADIANKIKQLNSKREAATTSFLLDLAKLGTNIYVPGASIFIDLAASAITVGSSHSANLKFADKVGQAAFEKHYSALVGKTPGQFAQVLSTIERLRAVEREADALGGKLKANLFNIGGRELDGAGRADYGKHDLTYDLQAQLQILDLEKNGLRAYMYRSLDEGLTAGERAEIINKFDKYIEKLDSLDRNTKDLILGTDDKTLTERGISNIRDSLNEFSSEFNLHKKDSAFEPFKTEDYLVAVEDFFKFLPEVEQEVTP